MKFNQIIKQLLNLPVPETWNYYLKLCKDPYKLQMKVLNAILENNKYCRYGKKQKFSDLKTLEDFIQNVPISSWKDNEKASLDMQKGSTNILFEGKPDCFIMTSGTSGKQKLIPETPTGKIVKNITDRLRRNFTIHPHPEIMHGKILPLVNRADLGFTECGIPFGTASGLTMQSTPETLVKAFSFPPEILTLCNNDTMDYLIMRFSLNHDVRLIVGNNIARMAKLVQLAGENIESLISEIRTGTLNENIDIEPGIRQKLEKYLIPNQDRANFLQTILDQGKRFIPECYWPDLKVICCWLSGSVGASVTNVKKLFPVESVYLDYGYGASEGKFNIPHTPEKSAGTLTIHSSFFEFLPVNENNTNNTLMAHQVKDGQLYRLIVTNFAGLYRYDMKDIVKIEGFTENTPNIVFISKYGDIGNIVGEKLSGSTIFEAAIEITRKSGISIRHICAVTVQEPAHYIFCIEFIDSEFDITSNDVIRKSLDLELQKDIGYGNRRRDNLLHEPELLVMEKGWLDSLYDEKVSSTGNSIAQIKLPVIYNSIPGLS